MSGAGQPLVDGHLGAQFVAGQVVVSYCTGISTLAQVTAFALGTWAPHALASGVSNGFAVSATSGLLAHVAAGLEVVPWSGPATIVDADGQSGVFTSDGQSVVYVSDDGALKRTTIASPAPVTLTPGVAGIVALSPDDQTALVYDQTNGGSGWTDVYLVGLDAPGPLKTLSAAATAEGLFLLDSSHMKAHMLSVPRRPRREGPGRSPSRPRFPALGATRDRLAMEAAWPTPTHGGAIVFASGVTWASPPAASQMNVVEVDTASSASPPVQTTLVTGAMPSCSRAGIRALASQRPIGLRMVDAPRRPLRWHLSRPAAVGSSAVDTASTRVDSAWSSETGPAVGLESIPRRFRTVHHRLVSIPQRFERTRHRLESTLHPVRTLVSLERVCTNLGIRRQGSVRSV